MLQICYRMCPDLIFVHYSRKFVLQAFDNWGFNIKQYYGKTTKLRDSDFTNNYLSYWTDNGKRTVTFNVGTLKVEFIFYAILTKKM